MSVKVDLHTHSTGSADGGLTEKDYIRALEQLDLIAVTDHDSVDMALKLARKLKGRIIVGEEIMTTDGEIIGLYLSRVIPSGMSVRDTVEAIKQQEGIIIAPHPADKYRKGLSIESLNEIANEVDAIELYNGRAIGANPGRNLLKQWSDKYHCPIIASSDAHSASGLGVTYTTLESMPQTAAELRVLLRTTLSITYAKPPISAFLAPKINRIRRKMRP